MTTTNSRLGVALECEVRSRPRVGEAASGDIAVVHSAGSVTWVAVVDGLGHGPLAAEAAQAARSAVERLDADTDMATALGQLHQVLRPTRGVAIAVARYDATGVDLAGVGNVTVRGLGGLSLPYTPTRGILGGRYGTPRVTRSELPHGARMLFMTDGIARRAPVDDLDTSGAGALCDALMEGFARDHDDATVAHVVFFGGTLPC